MIVVIAGIVVSIGITILVTLAAVAYYQDQDKQNKK